MSTLSIRPNVGVSMEDRVSVNVVKLKYSPISRSFKVNISLFILFYLIFLDFFFLILLFNII